MIPFTATFVGEVQLNPTVVVPLGFGIVSSAIPQAGYRFGPYGGPDLGFGIPLRKEVVYQFLNSLNGYSSYQCGDYYWNCTSCSGPYLNVGESFFNFNTFEYEAPKFWTRHFVVGPP